MMAKILNDDVAVAVIDGHLERVRLMVADSRADRAHRLRVQAQHRELMDAEFSRGYTMKCDLEFKKRA